MNKNSIIICLIFAIITGLFTVFTCIHKNDVQKFQVVQSPTGNVSVVNDGGYYFAFMPKIWTYHKVNTVFFSNESDESKDRDGVVVRFSNKGQGDVSSQVVYRLFTNEKQIYKMHEYVSGNVERVEELILAKLKNIIMEKASNITSSQAIEDRELFADAIRKDIVNNLELADIGIVVEQYSITNIDFDSITTALFEAQQKADLQKKTAEAERQNLIMQKERSIADYDKQIAESKGRAEVEMMKQVTDAERQKKLAEIEAQKKVEVEKLAKEEAMVKASKLLELAEIEKKTETTKLEVIKIQADQKIASAKAKQQEIELSGAITETKMKELEFAYRTKVDTAQAIANGIATMKLPSVLNIGTGTSKGGNDPMSTLLNLLSVKQAMTIENQSK